ncbi:ubiquitin carboxyl-terminal hydrolase MINDY-2 [Phyllopteryx taeniolatus]|uniref:ubiquitin carboxyl-terminal hydrolase MINDY-2 n=1 Tax=Phyllopteryx taeniolatus TaxID=161469 RepID=UPI002AD4C18C|nr:ubiquitin carboxyl-terminal hydrolase MINDY-2 [Phyllopteryx taeniolatus]
MEMEKNADVHREAVGCDSIGADTGDAPAAGGGTGTAEKRPNSEARLSTLLGNDSCSNSAAEDPSTLHVSPGAARCDLAQVLEVLAGPQASEDAESSESRSGEQRLSNGMGSGPDKEGGASKLVNNQGVDEKESQPTKLAKPTRLCPAGTIPEDLNAPHALSEPDASLGGCESRSLDSLEDSFSKLNSCPSSDLEERGLALALHGEFGPDGTKATCAKDRAAGQSIYHIKWIKWREENTPIITQNENGPCPLLAIMNVLLLAWKVKMPPMMEIITAEQLMEYLGDYILETKPKEITEAQRLNYEQNMSDAMAVLHKLQTGLDVNVKFTGVRVFEYTPECIVFDLLDIPLYHGWLVDPQMHEIVKAVGNCSYNQLVEKIISCKQSENSELAGEGIVAEQFLNSTATQLTYHGLCELTSTVQEGELCVFFRNNHFSTMIKYKGQLYLLVTDQGFLTEEKVVWESLHNVDGDGNFCDSEFRLRPPSDPETVYRGQQDQIDQDYLMALSLQQEQQSQDLQWEQLPGISDLELAKKLQEEEDRRASQYYQEQEQEQAAAAAQAQAQQEAAEGDEANRGAAGAVGPAGGAGTAAGQAVASPGKQSSGGERKAKKEAKEKDKCVIL